MPKRDRLAVEIAEQHEVVLPFREKRCACGQWDAWDTTFAEHVAAATIEAIEAAARIETVDDAALVVELGGPERVRAGVELAEADDALASGCPLKQAARLLRGSVVEAGRYGFTRGHAWTEASR